MSRRHWSYLLLIGLAVGFLVAPDCADAQDAPKRIPMTAEDLAKFGIYLRFIDPDYHGSDEFYKKRVAGPNKCYYDTSRVLAVSDALLKHFEERGFSLRSLCLALQSSLRYDGATGKQLPLAVAARRSKGGNSLIPISYGEILLNVPDCFKNGTPGMDCPYTYEWSFGSLTGECSSSNGCKEKVGGPAEEERDRKIRKFIQGGGYARVCGCSEIRLHKSGNYAELTLPDDCNLDRLPACARRLVKDPDPAGRLIKKSGQVLFDLVGREDSSYLGGVDISPTLPRGYGYSIATEGGDVETEDVSLETLAKESGSAAPWNR